MENGGNAGRIKPGTRLNGIYVVEKLIAVGGMGEIYVGRAAETGVPVAIKMIRPELASDASVIGLFRREALALHQIRHEAIVAYYVFSIDPDLNVAYLAMEYVPGRPLSELVRGGPLGFDFVRVLQKRVASGLHAAHQLGVIHRDVSPDNIILPDGDPARSKIIDFGIAKNNLEASTIIGSGFAGKNSYVSPEQLGLFGGKITEKSDVYSLGLVLAEAFLGRQIDMGVSMAEVVEKRQSVPDLSGIDRRMQRLLRQMLDPDPANRPTMGDVATREVTGLAAEEDLPTTTVIQEVARRGIAAPKGPARTPALSPPAPPASRRTPLIAGAAAVVALLLAAGGYALWPDGRSTTTVVGSGSTTSSQSTTVATNAQEEAVRRREQEERARIEAAERQRQETVLAEQRRQTAEQAEREAQARREQEAAAERQRQAELATAEQRRQAQDRAEQEERARREALATAERQRVERERAEQAERERREREAAAERQKQAEQAAAEQRRQAQERAEREERARREALAAAAERQRVERERAEQVERERREREAAAERQRQAELAAAEQRRQAQERAEQEERARREALAAAERQRVERERVEQAERERREREAAVERQLQLEAEQRRLAFLRAEEERARREREASDEKQRQADAAIAEQQRLARERAEQAQREEQARREREAENERRLQAEAAARSQTASRNSAADAQPSSALRDCSQCPELAIIPEGTMQMGSNRDRAERPVRTVAVKPFVIGRHLVTVGEWAQCVRAGACPDVAKGAERNPVNNVSWDDVQRYLAWLSQVTGRKYRLPSEAEWEYAAKAGAKTRYWWGDEFSEEHASCRRCGPSRSEPLPAGGFKPNPFGLYDMTGNVAQWLSDCWHRDYRGAPKDSSSWSAGRCREQVVRGGSWSSDPAEQTVSARSFYDPGVRHPSFGFRVARDP